MNGVVRGQFLKPEEVMLPRGKHHNCGPTTTVLSFFTPIFLFVTKKYCTTRWGEGSYNYILNYCLTLELLLLKFMFGWIRTIL